MDVIIDARLEVPPKDSSPLETLGNFYHNLLCCLRYPASYPPVAELLRRYHHLDEGTWLVVSPVYWHATHNDAMIAASGEDLRLGDDEAHLWFTAFAEFVAAENMTLYYHDAVTWLLQADTHPPITANPVHSIMQQSLMPHLRRLDTTFFWQRFITETQMFFSGHPLNKQRGECPINGVWMWGNGGLQAPASRAIFTDDGLLAVAKLVSTHVSPYQRSNSYSKDSIVLLPDMTADGLHDLQIKLQSFSVHWFWNNLAYASKPRSWLSRLWR